VLPSSPSVSAARALGTRRFLVKRRDPAIVPARPGAVRLEGAALPHANLRC
jgi:hypothetical protein